jgi:phosphotransferase system IIB component
LGGTSNILEADICAVTRVRIGVKDQKDIDKDKLLDELGQRIIFLEQGIIQIIIGSDVSSYLDKIKKIAPNSISI